MTGFLSSGNFAKRSTCSTRSVAENFFSSSKAKEFDKTFDSLRGFGSTVDPKGSLDRRATFWSLSMSMSMLLSTILSRFFVSPTFVSTETFVERVPLLLELRLVLFECGPLTFPGIRRFLFRNSRSESPIDFWHNRHPAFDVNFFETFLEDFGKVFKQ